LKTLNLKKNSQVTVTIQTIKDEFLFELHFIYLFSQLQVKCFAWCQFFILSNMSLCSVCVKFIS